MALTSPETQRRHIEHGEQDIKEWEGWEAATEANLKAAEDSLNLNPNDPTLKQRRDQAAHKYEIFRQAREQREASVKAAKRCFRWTD